MKKYDVLALGELNVDLVLTGLPSLPVPGREIIAKGCSLTLGSSTAICVAGLARLGLKTAFFGKTGDDGYGELARESLAGFGVETATVVIDKSLQTGITVCLNSGEKADRALVTYLGAIDSLVAEDVPTELLASARHIHVGSFFLQKSLRPGLAHLFSKARRHGATTSLDAGWDDTGVWDYGIFDVLQYTDIFLPNESEALAITGEETVPRAARALAGYCGIAAVKWGGEGAFVASGDEEYHKPAFSAKVVDTTGAGDSFNAGFVYAYLRGLSIPECMDYGMACGAKSVTRAGGAASCPTAEEAAEVIKRKSAD